MAYVLCCATAFGFGGAPKNIAVQVFTQGGLAYLIGRHLVPAVGREWTIKMICVVLTLVGVWAICEYAFSWHPFVGLDPSSPEAFWSALQTRGSHVRSEAAFGHAISLGAALAAGVPFVLMSSLGNRLKIGAVLILALGLLTTVSRGPILAATLGAALVVLFAGRRNLSTATRTGFATLFAVIAVPAAYLLTSRLTEAGGEVESSTNYRSLIYNHILQDVHVNSVARYVEFSARGAQSYRGSLHSIDSTFVETALVFGWLPVAIVVVGLIMAITRVVRRQASAAEFVLVGQLPVLATVALITQYYFVIWLIAGIAVGSSGTRSSRTILADAISISDCSRAVEIGGG